MEDFTLPAGRLEVLYICMVARIKVIQPCDAAVQPRPEGGGAGIGGGSDEDIRVGNVGEVRVIIEHLVVATVDADSRHVEVERREEGEEGEGEELGDGEGNDGEEDEGEITPGISGLGVEGFELVEQNF